MRALIPALLLVAGCDSRPDRWDAFVYPDGNNLDQEIRVPGFKSFELCQQGAITLLRAEKNPDAGDYKCGYKCRSVARYGGIDTCKETRK